VDREEARGNEVVLFDDGWCEVIQWVLMERRRGQERRHTEGTEKRSILALPQRVAEVLESWGCWDESNHFWCFDDLKPHPPSHELIFLSTVES
jgi:hypothetical protein